MILGILIIFTQYSIIPKTHLQLWKENTLAFDQLKSLIAFEREYKQDRLQIKYLDRNHQHIADQNHGRIYKRLDEISPWLLLAVTASEDERFWVHQGFDVRAILRAIYQNIKGKTEGGSTITQQLAKAWIGNEKSLSRKIRELNLAIHIEKQLSKEEILERYLNEIYFGQQAYGIEQASWTYFRKSAIDLTLAESCILAGVIPQPSYLNPIQRFQESIEKALRILYRLEQLQWISHEQRMMARSKLLSLTPSNISDKLNHKEAWAPFYIDHAHKSVIATLQTFKTPIFHFAEVELFVDLLEQSQAQEKIWFGVNHFAQKQGFFGALSLDKPENLRRICQRSQSQWAQVYQVQSINAQTQALTLHDPCDLQKTIAITKPSWFKAFDPKKTHNPTEKDPLMAWEDQIKTGDLLWLRNGELIQNPYPSASQKIEGALISMDIEGRVSAMVGSTDYQQSQFNRAIKSCRPIGSLIKPFIYWYAFLYSDVQLDTILSDAPVTMYDASSDFLWKPNDHQKTTGQGVSIKEAISKSLNLPIVHLVQKLGISSVRSWLLELGFHELSTQFNFVLGSGCESLVNMIQLFSLFPKKLSRVEGQSVKQEDQVKAKFIKKISTPLIHHKTLIYEDQRSLLDANDASDLAELMLMDLAEAQSKDQQNINDQKAVQNIDIALKSVLSEGTGKAFRTQAKALDLAGKTGSTDLYDAWFIGYQSNRVTGVWVGNDLQKKAIGQGEGGGSVALPIVINWLESIAYQDLWRSEKNKKLNFSPSPSKNTIHQNTKKPKQSKPKVLPKQKMSDEELEGEF